MTVVVRMMIRKRPWSVLVSRAHAYTKIIVCLLVPVFYPVSLWALAGCFPQTIVNVVSAGSVAAFEDNGDSESDVIVILTST